MAGRIRFGHIALPNVAEPRILTMKQIPNQPVLSREHVPGGSPTGGPVSQGNRPGSQVDPQSGFQVLGDDALSGAMDSMYGPMDDGTVNDIVGGQEVRREIPQDERWTG
jgi:hypothetical protein